MVQNRCVACGRIIPEGRQICLQCEYGNDFQKMNIPTLEELGDVTLALQCSEEDDKEIGGRDVL